MSPGPFYSRAKTLLVKRSEKGYGDENDTLFSWKFDGGKLGHEIPLCMIHGP